MSLRNFETMEHKVVIYLTTQGAVIGQVAEGLVTRPRIITIDQLDEKRVNVTFQQLFGDPDVFFGEGAPFYISENAGLNELYIERVTPKSNIII